MTISARDYQSYAVDAMVQFFYDHLSTDENQLVCMPTGTGKSIIISMFCKRVFDQYPNQKIMMLTHVKELIEQNYEKLIKLWPSAPAGVFSAGLNRRDTHQKIIFAGIQSVAKRPEDFGVVNLILVDEAHLVSPTDETNYQRFIAGLRKKNPHLRIIGLTATPWRLGHGKLIEGGHLFTHVSVDMCTIEAFNWFFAQGYLLPPVPKKTNYELDVSDVHTRGGEFIDSELQHAIDKDEITEKALREAMVLGEDRKSWLVFCAGVEHAIHTAEMLTHLGISCEAVHSNLGARERADILARFKSGKLRAVTNNNVLTTGFDHPGIDLIIMLRPTQSSILWVQMLGRGTRPAYAPGYDLSTTSGRLAAIAASDKQNCLVLDFAGNSKRMGPINDPLIPRKKGDKKGEAPIKVCPGCESYVHASVRLCPFCNYEFPIETKLKVEASTEVLVRGDTPVVEEFEITHVSYTVHRKAGKPDMMKVAYCGDMRAFYEYVCFEHDNFAGRKARQWWRKRTGREFPESTEDALKVINSRDIKVPTSIKVWTNKPGGYPEIMDYCFDGSNFGKNEALPITPTIQVGTAQKPVTTNADEYDDDIPF